jgi:hypothetical protein
MDRSKCDHLSGDLEEGRKHPEFIRNSEAPNPVTPADTDDVAPGKRY